MTTRTHIPESIRRRRDALRRRASRTGAGTGQPRLFPDADTAADLVLSRLMDRALHRDEEVDRWIEKRRVAPSLRTDIVALDQLTDWRIHPSTGDISHASGRFFSLVGVSARHRTADGDLEWDQPIIDQPEIGILGILAKKIDGVLHFCLQAKEEPGNIHSVQLSPTVQATYSNYTRVHGGKQPPFVERFFDPPKEKVLFAKLQTEDGGRFLFKSNRNMIVRVDDGEMGTLPDGFIWLTLRQISRLVRIDNLVNACARSVLAGLFSEFVPCSAEAGGLGARRNPGAPASPDEAAFRTSQDNGRSWRNYAGLIQWIDDRKAGNHIVQKRTPLNSLRDWRLDAAGHLHHGMNRYFKVLGVRVNSLSREVGSWSQPILDNVAPGIIGLLVRQTDNGTEFLMQAKAEVGNRTIVQIAPTVQFTQENYQDNASLNRPFLFKEFQDPHGLILLSESRQSEEGARFFREEHLHRVLMLPRGRELELPPDFRWLHVDEISFLLHLGEQINSCARSILASMI